jgi:crotonyl-CoA reductase
MKLKKLISSHFANYHEAAAANKLISQGKIHPIMSDVYPLERVGEAALAVHRNQVEGKLGVLCLAPEEGMGIDDPEFREKVGEDAITRFRVQH